MFSATYYVAGSLNEGDLDNISKGIIDTLVTMRIVKDDTMQYVRKKKDIEAISLCDDCQEKHRCFKNNQIRQCTKEYAIVKLEDYKNEKIDIKEDASTCRIDKNPCLS